MLHIDAVESLGQHFLRLKFDNGVEKVVDARPILLGPVFHDLQRPEFFRQVSIDPVARTVVWPNGTDVAPEALYALASVSEFADACGLTLDESISPS